MKVSAFLRAGHKVGEVANLFGVSPTTIYAIKKRMDDGKGVTDVPAVVERLLWFVTTCGMIIEAVSRMASLLGRTLLLGPLPVVLFP